MHLHIQWTGPYYYSQALEQRDESKDYGVYQIYGSHPVYGSDVLLYLGKAAQQTFGVRLSQEPWIYHNQDSDRISVYLGHLHSYNDTPSNEEWSSRISIAERLLIYAHWPAGNSSGLNARLSTDLHEIHILNWGKYRDLLPEVSGARYSDRFYSNEGYEAYKKLKLHA